MRERKMAALRVSREPAGGFSFENCRRNAFIDAQLTKQGFKVLEARKTGTTIAGIVFKDGVILGADTRATEGMIVADKNCSKIHFIAPNIYYFSWIVSIIDMNIGNYNGNKIIIIDGPSNENDLLPQQKGRVHRQGNYKYKRGITATLTESVNPLQLDVVEEVVHTMDTS
uniref:proteasome subunit beta type-7-like n=1 Tax=Pristiophorus japonicus TaxID=55135 RepID=UPI00398E7AD6